MKTNLLLTLIYVCILWCCKNKTNDPVPPTVPVTFDCIPGSGAEELIVNDDPYNTFTPTGGIPFNGYADPSIRKDPH